MPYVTSWRWDVRVPAVPLKAALWAGEGLRAATTRAHKELGFGLLPEAVHRDEGQDHRHAFWLPGDGDGDGLVDYVWVSCANGLPASVIAAMAVVDSVRVGAQAMSLEPAWMGPLIEEGPFGPARIWRGVTPYVTPKWRLTKTGKERAKFTPDAQIQDEIAMRGLPDVTAIAWQPTTWDSDGVVLASSFEMTRHKGGEDVVPPKDAVASFPTITFAEPVMGPLALGYGAHFGLGQLVPVG